MTRLLVLALALLGCGESRPSAASSAGSASPPGPPAAASASASVSAEPPSAPSSIAVLGSAPPPPPRPARPRVCSTLRDCLPNEVCRFDEAGCGDSHRGICAAAEAPCDAPFPYCACNGRVVTACSRPAQRWLRERDCPR